MFADQTPVDLHWWLAALSDLGRLAGAAVAVCALVALVVGWVRDQRDE